MQKYTLFLPNGTPTRAQLMLGSWILDASTASTSPPTGLLVHELTHTVQQGGRVRAWVVRNRTTTTSTSATTSTLSSGALVTPDRNSGWIPEIDDEVLIAFEHGDARQTSVYFGIGDMTSKQAAQWMLELGTMTRGGVKLRVRNVGAGKLSIAAASSAVSSLSGGGIWARIL